MRKKITVINEEARATLDISRDEYALCQYAHYRSSDPRMKKAGWCSDGRQEIADFVGITPRGLYKMIHKLSNISLIDIDSVTGFIRATSVFIDAENQKSIGTKFLSNRNKVPIQSEQSSEPDVNKVPIQYKGIVRVSKNKGEGEKAADAATPAPLTENQEADNISNLEANTTSTQMNAAAGPRAPRPSDKPQGVEFHTDLAKQIGAFYKVFPAQWTDGVKQGPGSRYTNEQLVSMLDDYCSHCFANRNTYATFSQHHGNFIRWIKNQKQFERPTVAALPEKQADVTRFYNQIPVTK